MPRGCEGFWIGLETGSLRHVAAAFAEGEGLFEGFGEAGFVAGGDLEAVLDDEDFFGEFFELGWRVGADDFAFEEDAEVALGVEEGEEVGRFCVLGDGDGEEDEDLFFRVVL